MASDEPGFKAAEIRRWEAVTILRRERDEARRQREELLEAIEAAYGLIQTASSRRGILRARDLLYDTAERIREGNAG